MNLSAPVSQEEKDFWGLGEFNRGGHAWNVVKINGKYYQSDVTNAVGGQRGYQPFLRTDADMWSIFHEGKYTPTELYPSQNGEHPYLSFQQAQGQAAGGIHFAAPAVFIYVDAGHGQHRQPRQEGYR